MRDGLLLGGFLVGVLMSSVFVTEPIFSPGECNEIIESVNKKKNIEFQNCCPPGVCRYAETEGLEEFHGQCGCNLRQSLSLQYDQFPFVFQKFYDVAEYYNNKYYGFEIESVSEIHINKYAASDRQLEAHIDWGHVLPTKRKITVSMSLSPLSAYEGGILSCYETDQPVIGAIEQGAATVFPSWTLHELSRVTSGERYSAVGWIVGTNSFR